MNQLRRSLRLQEPTYLNMSEEEELWSKLPDDLLAMIGEYVVLYVDKIRFRCVCSNWLSGLSQLPNLRQSEQPPWLLLPYNSNNTESGSLCGLYHPFENKVYEIDLPEAGEKVFRGSDFGWVVTLLENGSIYVVNPLSRVRHQLPPRYTFPDVLEYRPDRHGEEFLFTSYYSSRPPYDEDSADARNYSVSKIVLSCNPSFKNDFSAVAICTSDGNTRLAYCKCGDNKWLDLHTPCHRIRDITFREGKLYVLTMARDLLICVGIHDSCPRWGRERVVRGSTKPSFKSRRTHLVNSSTRGLMAVYRAEHSREIESTVGDDPEYIYNTDDFEIYKPDKAKKRWIKVKSLGHRTLFMGKGGQVGNSFRGNKGNRIYFASNRFSYNSEDIENIFDNGIFNIEDKRIDPLGYMCNPKVIWPCPIWVIPNPY